MLFLPSIMLSVLFCFVLSVSLCVSSSVGHVAMLLDLNKFINYKNLANTVKFYAN